MRFLYLFKKWFQYLILSYLVAIISIVLVYVTNIDSFTQSIHMNCINIIFSTNACFTIATAFGLFDNEKKITDGILSLSIVGLCLCTTFNTLSILKINIPINVYWGGIVMTSLICLYLAAVYSINNLKISDILENVAKKEQLESAKKIINAGKEVNQFEDNGATYKL